MGTLIILLSNSYYIKNSSFQVNNLRDRFDHNIFAGVMLALEKFNYY